MTCQQRHRILAGVAAEIRRCRGDVIGAAAANTGKVFTEADVEVSEAVDFAEYYPFSTAAFCGSDHLGCRGKGVGVVISPWNFPIAIPCGGIVASHAAGNTVIFKPSSDATLVAWVLCQCFWRAGVSQNVYELDKGLIKSLPIIDCIRYSAPERVPRDVSRAAADVGFYIARNR